MPEEPTPTSTPIAEIDNGPSPFEQFLDSHQKKLIIVGILVILVLAGLLIYAEIKKSYHAKAAAAFASAQDMPALRGVIDDYSDTPAAATSMLKLSQMQWQNAEQKDAVKTLRKLIATYPDHPLAPSATSALASHQMELGELDKAKENFKKVTAYEDHQALAPLALLNLGDIARREGKIDEARKYYQEIESEKYSQIAYSTSSMAKGRLALLDVAPPEKNEAAKTPENETGTEPSLPGADPQSAAPESSPELPPSDAGKATSKPKTEPATAPSEIPDKAVSPSGKPALETDPIPEPKPDDNSEKNAPDPKNKPAIYFIDTQPERCFFPAE